MKLQETKRNLAKINASLKIIHLRTLNSQSPVGANGLFQTPDIKKFNLMGYVSPTGGATIARLIVNKKRIEAIAECSTKDKFCKKEGVKIAVGRALKEANLEKELVE